MRACALACGNTIALRARVTHPAVEEVQRELSRDRSRRGQHGEPLQRQGEREAVAHEDDVAAGEVGRLQQGALEARRQQRVHVAQQLLVLNLGLVVLVAL